MSASPSMSGGNRGLWALRVPFEFLGEHPSKVIDRVETVDAAKERSRITMRRKERATS
jgi:hypothetical protein